VVVKAEPVLPGVATGVVLRCARPLSFWGGVDPATGRITDPESEHRGEALAGRVLMLAATRGSSSSSSVLLELVAAGIGPAAIVLGEVDAILGIGIVVGRELGHRGPPLLRLDPSRQAEFSSGDLVAVAEDGEITRVHGVTAAAGTGIAEGPEQLRQRVARLREEHRDLDEAIARLSGDALHDQVSLQRLKKRKLALKDQVLRLEAMLVPDIIA
jgi:predicted aconitase with swiveling domain